MRLQRALARAGVASRRGAEDLIRAGLVRVNGAVAQIGLSVDPDRDEIVVSDKTVRAPESSWIALNKPVGCVVSRRNTQVGGSVFDLVPDVAGLTYVGRLDVATSGLLLLTNDGTAVERLTHPKYQVQRAYRAVVQGRSSDEIRVALSRRPAVDGRPVAMVNSKVTSLPGDFVELAVVLTEGRHRIVRRLCEAIGVDVLRLERTGHGPISLGTLPSGQWRALTRREIAAIDSLSRPSKATTKRGVR